MFHSAKERNALPNWLPNFRRSGSGLGMMRGLSIEFLGRVSLTPSYTTLGAGRYEGPWCKRARRASPECSHCEATENPQAKSEPRATEHFRLIIKRTGIVQAAAANRGPSSKCSKSTVLNRIKSR